MKILYQIILNWSEEDQAFIAKVPELPGCAADGETYQEALQNVEVIMQEWIETAQELGRKIPEPIQRLRPRLLARFISFSTKVCSGFQLNVDFTR
ncbi:hypothetical protein Cylst_0808 [Cylindrospermum stagnale PCC 7417]|uniref:HicB-like antitoxin of toxin-antitoxin system domain-containing protein n=1 Tax=Cylindrospermum stagnale PCC 7417 TaxID=56107 RepID=K9WRY9_9NOST|nr:hypothetical protein Cylst_0808 [Cylindrospermum stagnale PCC 7417]